MTFGGSPEIHPFWGVQACFRGQSYKFEVKLRSNHPSVSPILTSNMNLQVLPRRALVSRQVIREGMDYTRYQAGKTRGEMDILDRLAGI